MVKRVANYLKAIAITALLSTHVTLSVAQSGSGTTTRYWYELYCPAYGIVNHD